MRRFPLWKIWIGSLLLVARASAEPPPSAAPPTTPEDATPEPDTEPKATEVAPSPPDQPPSDTAPSPEPPPAPSEAGDEAKEKPKAAETDAAASEALPADLDEVEDLPPVVPDASDTRGGHLTLGGFAGLAYPFGTIERDVSLGDSTTLGPAFGADLGFGVSRTTMIGVYGELALPGNDGPCADCSPQSIAAGLFLRYHLVQGLSFDPWMQAGVGVRLLSFGGDTPSYTAIDWLRAGRRRLVSLQQFRARAIRRARSRNADLEVGRLHRGPRRRCRGPLRPPSRAGYPRKVGRRLQPPAWMATPSAFRSAA